ncbi:Gldg family protein [Luteolibacter pohnpeiensis]|uniref:Gldg family protein n=1 Tax=Luteolibacter pohnpeiensis TaxID=454153 RepID=A0A934S4X5_9BACT|nr:Gldg family protein [Luteolibacter pohnpeiensis]MBK1882611.1 Gldg family protein [Luteolibacter pohnpeiensis]
MSDTQSKTKGKSARPVNRWGVGTLSIIQLVLLAAILLAANYLSSQHYDRLDLSREGAYTVSSSTRRYLTSDAIQKQPKPIKMILAFRRTSPFYDRVRTLLEEYSRLSHGKIELEILDPIRSPDRTQEVAAAYGITLIRDLIIIDSRTDDAPVIHEDQAGTKALNANVKLVLAEDMIVYSTDQQGQRRPIGFKIEDVMTAQLVQSIEGKPRKMYFLSDKSRIDSEGENSPWKSLETTIRYQNIQLTALSLAGLTDIPEDAEGVALVAPKYDLTEDEANVLERYWNRPKSSLLVLLEPGETPPRLRAFLRENGVTPQNDRIVTREKGKLVTAARGNFTYGIDFLKDLAGLATVFEGSSSSIEVREGATDLINRKIFPTSLILVTGNFWGETRFGQGDEQYDPKEDTKAPLTMAASVVRGAAADDRFAEDTSRMILTTNTDFLKPENQRAENMDFLASSVNWLVGRESLAGIGPRSIGIYKMPILDAQVSFINRVNLFFLPALLALIGGIVWSSRRA